MSLKELIIQGFYDGSLKDSHIAEWKKEALTKKIEHERQREEAKRRREAEQAEKMKFENRFPYLCKYRHVQSWDNELNQLCQTADLGDMERYYSEMLSGQHKTAFLSNAAKFDSAMNYLGGQISIRKSKLDPEQEKLRLLREARAETAENKKHLADIKQQLEATQQTAQALLKPQTDKATKAYTS